MAELRDFVVFERLIVDDLEVIPKRVKARYTFEKPDGSRVSTHLMYSYPKAFLSPVDPADINLASMMAIQVAINYGLFCKEVVFDGLFDKTDQRFINYIIENTSREIYVNKLLFPNEFLIPEFRNVEVQRLKRYTAAHLVFRNSKYPDMKVPQRQEEPDKDQYAILASGGKDSLLTYGLIKEIGEAHPVFVNESGRHWYTAYNAFRRFTEIEPNTVKPWCNSDRIFNWALRQMPFIRKDFQDVRADMYPIRLWTVAVFLFGVLPVVRKRKLGNILIGNEYDCTQQTAYEGISHYNSLYDQSKFFDNAFSRYYKAKGWNIFQYSILRPLSELLILKILVERYPDLQRYQVSCHAAHKEGDKMIPCGNCEKCRRIVGMMTSLGVSPERCGYKPEQVAKGLKALETKKVKQIGPDASQLYYLLQQQGHIKLSQEMKKTARERPEILKLRFDAERSQLRDVPRYIRKPLFEIYGQYADGAVKYDKNKWHDYDPVEASESVTYFINDIKSNEEFIQ